MFKYCGRFSDWPVETFGRRLSEGWQHHDKTPTAANGCPAIGRRSRCVRNRLHYCCWFWLYVAPQCTLHPCKTYHNILQFLFQSTPRVNSVLSYRFPFWFYLFSAYNNNSSNNIIIIVVAAVALPTVVLCVRACPLSVWDFGRSVLRSHHSRALWTSSTRKTTISRRGRPRAKGCEGSFPKKFR